MAHKGIGQSTNHKNSCTQNSTCIRQKGLLKLLLFFHSAKFAPTSSVILATIDRQMCLPSTTSGNELILNLKISESAATCEAFDMSTLSKFNNSEQL
jgi:hypothetical protein